MKRLLRIIVLGRIVDRALRDWRTDVFIKVEGDREWLRVDHIHNLSAFEKKVMN